MPRRAPLVVKAQVVRGRARARAQLVRSLVSLVVLVVLVERARLGVVWGPPALATVRQQVVRAISDTRKRATTIGVAAARRLVGLGYSGCSAFSGCGAVTRRRRTCTTRLPATRRPSRAGHTQKAGVP